MIAIFSARKLPSNELKAVVEVNLFCSNNFFVAVVVAGSYPLNFLAINRTFGPPKTMKPLKKKKIK